MWALQRFAPEQRQLFLRFWKSASGFWRGRAAWIAWSLTISLIVVVLLQLFIQYELNLWNRNFFDALGRRNSRDLWRQVLMFFPLIACSVMLAAASVWGRMTAQRRWRRISDCASDFVLVGQGSLPSAQLLAARAGEPGISDR